MSTRALVTLGFSLALGCSGALGGDAFVASGRADGQAPVLPSAPSDASATSDDGSVPPDASLPEAPPLDAGRAEADHEAADAAPPPPVTIACGAGTALSCTHPPDVCCIATAGARSCVPASACDGTPVTCAGRGDCAPGEVCCGAYDRTAKRYESIACASTCTRADDAGFEVVFCALRNGDSDCAPGLHCIPSTVYVGFTVCG